MSRVNRWGTRYGSHWIARRKRHAIYARDSYRCVWCGEARESIEARGSFLTLDHLDDRAGHWARNLVTACQSCNSARGSKSVGDWLRELEVLEFDVEEITRRLDQAAETPIEYREGRCRSPQKEEVDYGF